MRWPEITAIYGAILATIVFSWNIYLVIRDRPHIQVKCYEGVLATATNEKYPQALSGLLLDLQGLNELTAQEGTKISITEELIIVTASNRSRRPVTITMWGVGYKEGGYLSASPPVKAPLPHRLKEGESYTLWVSKKSFIEELKKDGKTPGYVFIKTADGRLFKKKGFPVKFN